MKIAIHQPNLWPWFPYFYKMHRADIFVLLTECQFEKNGYQNRARIAGKWWTMPVRGGLEPIKEKMTFHGIKVADLSEAWVRTMAATLGIDPKKIRRDFPTTQKGTDRIIEICRHFKADTYLTNPDAGQKYLDEEAMRAAGIKIEYVDTPHKRHVFELFHECGVQNTIDLLYREYPKNEVS
jgi:hypothetical protein